MVINLAKIRLGKAVLEGVRLARVDFSGGRVKGPDFNDDFNDDFLIGEEAEEATETE